MDDTQKQQVAADAFQQMLIQQRHDAQNMVCALNARLAVVTAELNEAQIELQKLQLPQQALIDPLST